MFRRLVIPSLIILAFIFPRIGYTYEINDYGQVNLPITGRVIHVPGDYVKIQDAINAASSGDTVLVGPGTFNENINFNNKDISLLSTDGPNKTTISGVYGTVITGGPGGKIYGFKITNGSASFGAGIYLSFNSKIEIKYNIFEGNRQGSGGFGAAIGGNGASPLIDNNYFTNNTCDTQFLSGVVSLVNGSSPRIINNVFDSNPCRAIDFTVPEGAAPQIINNTIVRNRVGIYVDRRINSINQIYRNNIIYDNDVGVQAEFGNEGYNPVFENNLVYGNTVDYKNISNMTGVKGNISEDPLFVDPVNNLHIRRNSPAVDAGSSLGAPLVDFDGEKRPFDGNSDGIPAFDIGADEFSSKLSIAVSGGIKQECSSTGGNNIEVTGKLSLDSDPISSITWSVDGEVKSMDNPAALFIPLGKHIVTADAISQSGKEFTAETSVQIVDTAAPAINAEFVDRRTGEVVTSIDNNMTQWIMPKVDLSDTCDSAPTSTAIGGVVFNQSNPVKVQGNLGTISIRADELTLQVTASDASGNESKTTVNVEIK